MKEAIEQVNGLYAFNALVAKKSLKDSTPDDPFVGQTQKEIADTPHLTGDPEWDELELAETDPSREPLKILK